MAKVSKTSPDPRVKRTRKLLREAFLSLLKEKHFDSVHVRDITARAEVNNATFYLHYVDKWDMLNQIVEEIRYGLDASRFIFSDTTLDLTQTPPLEVKLIEHINTYREFYQLMLGRHGVPSVAYELRRQLEQIAASALEDILPASNTYQVPRPLITRFIASAYVGVIEWWLESKAPVSPEELAGWLWKLQTVTSPDELLVKPSID